jgi:hypothetical protein
MTNETNSVAAVHRVNLHKFLHDQEGKFVAVDFIKLNGEKRMLCGRLGVTQHSKGGPNKVEAEDRPYLVMYDVQNKGYRTVNLSTVHAIRAQNRACVVVD